MRDVEDLLSDISSIRAQLVSTTRFLGISPGFNLVLALLSFVVAFIQWLQGGESQLASPNAYISTWASFMVASIAITSIDAISRSRRLHGKLANAVLVSIFYKILPFFIAAVIMTAIIWTVQPASLWIVPGLWQMIIGLLGFSAISSVPQGLVWVATWFFVCGVIVMGVAGVSETLSPWLMGIPFTIGHLVIAILLHRSTGGNSAK